MIYLDASAAVKLILPEPESEALAAFVDSASEPVTSIVSAVEVPRAVERVTSAPEALARIDELLERIDIRVLDQEVATLARSVPAAVRSLDAIHLATALAMSDALEVLVAYDERLLEGARELGLAVAEPR